MPFLETFDALKPNAIYDKDVHRSNLNNKQKTKTTVFIKK